MPSLKLAAANLTTTKADALVVLTHTEKNGSLGLAPGLSSLDKAIGSSLLKALKAVGATGKANDLVRIPTLGAIAADSIIAVGIGSADASPEALRRALGTATRGLNGSATVAIALPVADPALVQAGAEGAMLGAYSFDDFRGKSKADRKPPVKNILVLVADPKAKANKDAITRTAAIAEAMHWVRDLVNMPPDALYPAALAALATDRAKGFGLEVKIWDEKELKKSGFGGIVGVGQGSVRGPRLAKVTYTHPKAKKSVAFVGKGVTFDSGGLSLKPPASMETMKCDMAGAAAVLGAIGAIAALKVPVNVTAWVPAVENMPSGDAIRPSDVLRMYNGTTVEVLNTDAEGRLILADAIAKASEDQPDYMIDVATLTGACIVALGTRIFGVMGNDDLRTSIVSLAESNGEAAWPLPLPEDLKPSMESVVADTSNMGDRFGGTLVAGLFLQSFVGDDIEWAHLDIAGPAYNDGAPHGYTPKGGTGSAVRTLVAFAESLV